MQANLKGFSKTLFLWYQVSKDTGSYQRKYFWFLLFIIDYAAIEEPSNTTPKKLSWTNISKLSELEEKISAIECQSQNIQNPYWWMNSHCRSWQNYFSNFHYPTDFYQAEGNGDFTF